MNKLIRPVFVICIIFSLHKITYALSVDTHAKLNESISQNTLNNFSLNSFLIDKIGLEDGIKEKFSSLMIWELLRDGGLYEDLPAWYQPYLRSVNHFHNPLIPNIAEAGFTGIWGSIVLSGKSAILWAQYPDGTQSPGGYYSWRDVRKYFYTALTSTALDTRDNNFADTFRGLGQIMHLVEDMSVPEHVRDDGHYADAYEEWVRDTPSVVNNALANPIYPDPALLNKPSPFAGAPVPVANLFDSNTYTGQNPSDTLTTGSDPAVISPQKIGLSEYANANYFSPDTAFKSGSPYPALTSVVEYDDPVDQTSGKVRTYLTSEPGGTNEG